MAVISKIRKRSGFLVAIIGLSILGFVIQDMTRNQNSIPPFAVIDGKDIRYDDFQIRIEQLTQRYQQQMGPDMPLTAEDQEQIRTMAWQQMLNEIMLENSYEKLGITVSIEEMNDMYYGTFVSPYIQQMFTDPSTGVFNRQQVINIIQNYEQLSPEDKASLNEVEKAVKSERKREKYLSLLYKSYYVPADFAKAIAHKQMDVRKSEYVMLNYADMEDPAIDDNDYKKFYDKNKYMFQQQQEMRTIDYVVFSVAPTAEDMINIENQVDEYYEELKTIPAAEVQDFVNSVSPVRFDSIYKGRAEIYPGWDSALFNSPAGTVFAPKRMSRAFQMARLLDVQMRPDSLHAAHILIAYQGTANTNAMRTKDEAKVLADSLFGVIRRSGGSAQVFGEIAARHSDDPSKQQNGGDLGWMKEGTFIKEFNDAMIKNPVGSYTVVETAYGYHILFVVGKTAPVKKVLAALVSVPIDASNETDKAVYAEATKFSSECTNIGAMDSVARKYGQFKRSAQGVDVMSANLQGLSGAREIVRWAYDKKTEKGNVSRIFQVEGSAYVVAALNDVNKKGYMSLEQAKNLPAVTYAVTRDKKAEVLKEKLAGAASGLTNLYAVYQKIYAEDTNVVYDTVSDLTFNSRVYGQGAMEQDVVGAVFGMKQGVVSAPIKGFSGVYMINVLDAQKSSNVEGMLYPVKMNMEQSFQQSLQQGVSTALQKLAELEDNRAFYY